MGGERQTASSLSAGSFPSPAEVLTAPPTPHIQAVLPSSSGSLWGRTHPTSESGRDQRSQSLPGSGQMEFKASEWPWLSPQWAQQRPTRAQPSSREAETSSSARKWGDEAKAAAAETCASLLGRQVEPRESAQVHKWSPVQLIHLGTEWTCPTYTCIIDIYF